MVWILVLFYFSAPRLSHRLLTSIIEARPGYREPINCYCKYDRFDIGHDPVHPLCSIPQLSRRQLTPIVKARPRHREPKPTQDNQSSGPTFNGTSTLLTDIDKQLQNGMDLIDDSWRIKDLSPLRTGCRGVAPETPI